MKEFKNFDEAKKNAEYTGTEQIPVGAYVAKIMGVRYENGQNGNSDRIVIQFDIAEGEQKDFFAKQYEQNTADDKKWKGKTTIYVPKDDGTQKDQWTANTFARWVNAIEKSNDGYSWDWDESKWKDKKIGLIFGEVGSRIKNKDVKYVECRFPASVDDVKNGKCKIPEFKAKNGYGTPANNATSDNSFINTVEGADEIPF